LCFKSAEAWDKKLSLNFLEARIRIKTVKMELKFEKNKEFYVPEELEFSRKCPILKMPEVVCTVRKYNHKNS
jgi:hypothetical protein